MQYRYQEILAIIYSFSESNIGDTSTWAEEMKFKIVKFVFLSLFLYGFVSSTLTLSRESDVKQENEFLSVICRDKETGKPVSWKGPKNRNLDEKTNPIARKNSYGCQLIFNSIRREYAGTYICESKTESAVFELFVEGAPRLPSNTTEKHYLEQEIVYANIGETVNLTCEVEALRPLPKFNWLQKTKRSRIGEVVLVSPYKSILRLQVKSRADFGVLKCEVENQLGRLVLFRQLREKVSDAVAQ